MEHIELETGKSRFRVKKTPKQLSNVDVITFAVLNGPMLPVSHSNDFQMYFKSDCSKRYQPNAEDFR